jgi:hypothetical protein
MTGAVFQGLHALWVTALFIALGLALGTLVAQRLRLPAFFWMPLVLAASGFSAYLLFWIYFFWPVEARTVSTVAIAASALTFAIMIARPSVGRYLATPDAWLPGLLMLLLLTAYLACLRWTDTDAPRRFTVSVPYVDNILPHYIADRMYYGYFRGPGPPPPLAADATGTRSSDRPPLQTAIVLAVRPLQQANDAWTYQALATACQLAWVPAVYALSRALALRRRQIVAVLIATACSGFFLFNSLYTWPKLLSASLMLTGLALLIWTVRTAQTHTTQTRTIAVASTIAALWTLGLLAHSSVVFSIVALPLLAMSLRAWRTFSIASIVVGLCTAVVLLTPWLAYQRYYDPPGNRLVKQHLAGVEAIDSRSTLQAIADGYRGMTASAWLVGRWANIREQWFVGGSGRTHPVDWIQWQQFFHNVPALDVLAIGYVVAFVRRWRRSKTATDDEYDIVNRVAGNRESDRLLGALALYAIGALIVWIVMLFTPGAAMIHHGSYATTTILLVCGAAWVATIPRAWSMVVLALHVAIFAAAWLAMRASTDIPPQWHTTTGAIMIVAFVAFFVSLRFVPSESARV